MIRHVEERRRMVWVAAILIGLACPVILAESQPVFVESFPDGDRVLERWDYTGKSTPSIAPSPLDPKRNAFTLDFRVTRNWRMVSRKELTLAPGGQYTLAGRMWARGPYSTIILSVQRAQGGTIAQVQCPDTGGKSQEVSIIFWAPAEPAAARVAVAGGGCGGEVWLEEVRLIRNDPPLSTYPTGVCIRRPSQGEPFSWVGVMVQAEEAAADRSVPPVGVGGETRPPPMPGAEPSTETSSPQPPEAPSWRQSLEGSPAQHLRLMRRGQTRSCRLSVLRLLRRAPGPGHPGQDQVRRAEIAEGAAAGQGG